MEIAKRIRSLLKIKRTIRRPYDTTAIEQNIKNNRMNAVFTEAFGICRMTPMQIRVLELRYGLSGRPPLNQTECGRKLDQTRQQIFQLDKTGREHLTQHPDIFRALQNGLKAIQLRLWRQLADKNNALISKQNRPQELEQRASGPVSLLVKVCYGDLRKWLNKNLTLTAKGWQIPV